MVLLGALFAQIQGKRFSQIDSKQIPFNFQQQSLSHNPINIRFRFLEFAHPPKSGPFFHVLISYLSLTSPSLESLGASLHWGASWAGDKPGHCKRTRQEFNSQVSSSQLVLSPEILTGFQFPMALLHDTVNPIRSIPDLGTVKQCLYTDIDGK